MYYMCACTIRLLILHVIILCVCKYNNVVCEPLLVLTIPWQLCCRCLHFLSWWDSFDTVRPSFWTPPTTPPGEIPLHLPLLSRLCLWTVWVHHLTTPLYSGTTLRILWVHQIMISPFVKPCCFTLWKHLLHIIMWGKISILVMVMVSSLGAGSILTEENGFTKHFYFISTERIVLVHPLQIHSLLYKVCRSQLLLSGQSSSQQPFTSVPSESFMSLSTSTPPPPHKYVKWWSLRMDKCTHVHELSSFHSIKIHYLF